MEREQHERAKFYARLASIRDLGSLREWERLQLVEELQKVFLPWLEDSEVLGAFIQKEPPDVQKAARDYLTSGKLRQALPTLLSMLHHDAQRLITPLFVGAPVSVPGGVLPVPIWTLDLKTSKLQERWLAPKEEVNLFELPVRYSLSDLHARFLVGLIDFIRHSKRFPFDVCLYCLKIFAPVKRQRYCSPNCTYRGIEAARKDRKREYMRVYMAKRRKKQKAVRVGS